MVGGAPIVAWEPDFNTNGVIRTYKVYGKETLEGCGEWQYPTNSLQHFFKVTVEMPQEAACIIAAKMAYPPRL